MSLQTMKVRFYNFTAAWDIDLTDRFTVVHP
jgi:hypothetical protein